MALKEGYDVLRLIGHGQTCYISSEYVRGEIFAVWLKYHPHVTKKCLFSWIQSMTGQLGMFHKCRKKNCYQYMNPYSIVITEEKELYFLDMENSSNERQLRIMRRRAVREAFLPPEEPYYQKGSTELDIYGLGKTIQYLLAISEPDPPLTRREEKRFQRIISKCVKRQSKASYQNIEEIRKDIPEYQPEKKHFTRRKKILSMVGIVLMIIISYFFVSAAGQKEKEEIWQLSDQEEEEKDKGAGDMASESESKDEQAEVSDGMKDGTGMGSGTEISEYNEACMELALLYFLELEDYEKSQYFLDKIRSDYVPAEDLGMILEAFLEDGKTRDAEELKEHLESLEVHTEELEKADILEAVGSYYRCLIRGYGMLDTQDASEQLLQLGQRYLEGKKQEGEEEETIEAIDYGSDEDILEVMEFMAAANEKTGKTEEAAAMYEEILDREADTGKRQEEYQYLVNLYAACEKTEQALDTCIRGIEEFQDSPELRILHIRLLCRDASVGRNVCAQIIQEYISQVPEILEKEEFRKLQKEYEIQVEGGKVWVGK